MKLPNIPAIDRSTAGKEIKPSKKDKKGMLSTILEGLFTEAIVSTKKALDVFEGGESKLEPNKILHGIYGILRSETLGISEFMADINIATISPKHRLSKKINEITLLRLESLMVVKNTPQVTIEEDGTETIQWITKDINDSVWRLFMKLIVDYLTASHIVLYDQSSEYSRKKVSDIFVEKWTIQDA